MGGADRGDKRNKDDVQDDMIGIARVPLLALTKGKTIAESFDIVGNGGAKNGQVAVKITVINASTATKGSLSRKDKNIKGMEKEGFSLELRESIIKEIASKLGRLSLETKLMFGIFSRGTNKCTREDFKYCCLHRLDLKELIGSREIDMLLDSTIGSNTHITQNDFVTFFNKAIVEAREDANKLDATTKMMVQAADRQGNYDHRGTSITPSEASHVGSDAMRIMKRWFETWATTEDSYMSLRREIKKE